MGYAQLLLVFTLLQTISVSRPCDETFGEPWQPSWIAEPRNDLRCRVDVNKYCTRKKTEVKSNKYDKCCACRSCAVWEGKEKELLIEYVSVLGRSLVLSDQASNVSDDVYEINHIGSEMTEIPSNLCNWDTETNLKERYPKEFETLEKQHWNNIVKINFENNKIGKLTDLSCLKGLDELNLRNNKLTHVSNTSFTTLTHLRTIDFSGNLIQNIDPGILTSVHLNLFRADFSHNRMSKLDVSNMLSLYPFCDIDFKSNQINKLVNEANFTLEMTKSYGPGFVSFKNNDINEFPDLKELLHLDSIAQLGHLLSSGFDFRNVPIICDCHLQPFMSLSKNIKATIWPHYMNVSCTGPEDLVGIPVGNVDTHRLICELPADSGCPTPECKCTDRPEEKTIYINCSHNQGIRLGKLPTIPTSKFSEFISLDISGQKISDISSLKNLSNISLLNASGNDIREINNDVAKALTNATVDISSNINLRELPKIFLQYRNVCTTIMKNLLIDCGCDALWIETWLHSKNSKKCVNKENMFTCILPNGDRKPALLYKAADVECFTQFMYELLIAGVTLFLILIGILIFTFRFELLIICARIKQAGRSKVLSQYSYDVLLSFNDADEDVAKWVNGKLEDKLVDAGYRIFQPGQDITFGTERDSEVLKTICKTANVLVILSDSYLDTDYDGMRSWTENEWKYSWYNFLRDRHKNLIVVNFDHVSSFDMNHPQIKAFLRVGCTIDFKNHNRKIIADICKRLGKPYFPPAVNVKTLDNKNTKFIRQKSFTPALEVELDEEEDMALEANCEKVVTKQQFSSGIKSKYSSDVDVDRNNKFSYKKRIKHCNGQGQVQEFNGRFDCYYKDNSFIKTPHIPLFTKYKHKNERNGTKSESTIKRLEKLSKTYQLDVSALKDPECSKKIPECTQKKSEHYSPQGVKEKYTLETYYQADTSANELPQTSSNHLPGSSTGKGISEHSETEEVFNPDSNIEDQQIVFNPDSKTEDQPAVFQPDISLSRRESKVSGGTNSDDSGFDINSLAGSSSTFTKSIGASTDSFDLDSMNRSMIEITC